MKRTNPNKHKISPILLRILVCPACKGSLKLQKNNLKCTKCKRAYKIKDGVPFMIQKKDKRANLSKFRKD